MVVAYFFYLNSPPFYLCTSLPGPSKNTLSFYFQLVVLCPNTPTLTLSLVSGAERASRHFSSLRGQMTPSFDRINGASPTPSVRRLLSFSVFVNLSRQKRKKNEEELRDIHPKGKRKRSLVCWKSGQALCTQKKRDSEMSASSIEHPFIS